jgi:hypothetical protein
MSGLAHRRMARSLVACLRLRMAGAPPTIPWGALAGRRHSSATTAATAPCSYVIHARCNDAKRRARLRPSVHFTAAVDTGTSVRCDMKAATGAPLALRIREVTAQEAAPRPESSVRFARHRMPSRIGAAASAPLVRQMHSGMALARAAARVPAAPHQAGAIADALAVWLRPRWIPSLVAAAPVSVPIRHGGARDGALAVCQRHSEIRLLLADTSDPVADLDLDLSSGLTPTERSPSQEGLRCPRLAEVLRGIPEGPGRGSSWLLGRHRPSEPRRGARAGGGRGPGRKSPFFQNRVQGTPGRNSSRPQIGIEHPGSVHFRGPRPGFSFN